MTLSAARDAAGWIDVPKRLSSWLSFHVFGGGPREMTVV